MKTQLEQVNKSLLECTNLFSPNDYEKNNKIIKHSFVNRFLTRLRWGKSIVLSVKSIKILKSLKYHIFDI